MNYAKCNVCFGRWGGGGNGTRSETIEVFAMETITGDKSCIECACKSRKMGMQKPGGTKQSS